MANEERVIWEGDIQISLVAEIESSFFFARLYRRFFCFRFLSLFSCSGDFLPNNFSSIFNISKRRASKRFNPCERSLSALTMIPVGMCLICTHVDVLLTFLSTWTPRANKGLFNVLFTKTKFTHTLQEPRFLFNTHTEFAHRY